MKFELITVYNLYFNEDVNKWLFLIKKNGIIPKGSKLSVNILNNDLPHIATYFNNDNDDEFNLLIKMNKIKWI